jgi:hypothetical protein
MRSRLEILAAQPRLALGALLTLLLAAGAVVGSGADFTASSANPSNNSGSLAGDFTLTRGTLSNSDASNPLAAKLNVTVIDCGLFSGGTAPTCGDGDDATRYTGTLADMGTSGLGNFAAGAERRYRFEVALEGTAGNAYQGDSATVEFDFNAS